MIRGQAVRPSDNSDIGLDMSEKTLTIDDTAVDPLSLLKNPMILIGVVGFAFVVGMPYLLDSSESAPLH